MNSKYSMNTGVVELEREKKMASNESVSIFVLEQKYILLFSTGVLGGLDKEEPILTAWSSRANTPRTCHTHP